VRAAGANRAHPVTTLHSEPGPVRETEMVPRGRRHRGETLRRLLLAVVAMIVCVGITGPIRGLVSLSASLAVAHGASAHASGAASPECAGTVARPLDLTAIESDADDDDDDDDDVLGDVSDEPASQLAWAPPREPGRGPRAEITNDTSRFAISAHPARGPPA
jgi:hypothetical protein